MTIFADTYNFRCNTRGVYRKEVDQETGKVTLHYVSQPIYIKEIIRLLDTKEVFWNVRFRFNDGWHEEVISRQFITEKQVTILLTKGADVGGWKIKTLINYLFEAEKRAEVVYQHKFLGWYEYEKNYFYAHEKSLMLVNTINSQYVGEFNLCKKGSKDKWLETIRNYVMGHAEMELALCMGFSAILIGYVNQILQEHFDSLIFHISGNSTMGKTTAATVAVSGFGDAKEGTHSLIQSFNGTDNALTNLMSNNNGVPLVCDETSLSFMGTQKLVTVLYTWAKNVSKLRLDKNSNPKPRSKWATSIITTGEGSVIDQVNHNEGIRSRVFEFKNIQWTKSAAHSNSLVKDLSQNYGHGVEPFIKTLLGYSKSDISNMLEKETKQMESCLPKSKFQNRIGKKFALIIFTAKLLKDTFKFDLDIEAIRALLVRQEEESIDEREIGPKVVEQLKEWLLKNQKHFVLNKVQPGESQQIWGRIDVDRPKNKTVAYILPSAFEQMLKQYQYSDKSVVLRELDQMKVLVKEKDAKQNKYHTRRVIKGYESSKNGLMVYGIEFDSTFLQVDAMFNPTRRKGKKELMVDEREPEIVDIDDM